MKATLNIHSNILAFGDANTVTSNPKLRHVDWTTDYTQISIASPENKAFELAPGETRTLFSGVRSLDIDNTTELSLSLNAQKAGTYRLGWATGGGTAPSFRTERAVSVAGENITVTVNNNASAVFALDEASLEDFSAVSVGDILFIPDTTTGDSASPFNILNVGYWVVLSKGPVGVAANHKITCRRLPGETFQGASEAVPGASITDDAQFIVFSSGDVQVGDYVVISSGFSVVTQGTYQITAVTARWIEFVSSEPLPLEADVLPTTTGVRVFSQAKSFIHVETDQPAIIRVNGASGNELKIVPRAVADLDGRAWWQMWGPVWELVVVNTSSAASMAVQLISAAEAV